MLTEKSNGKRELLSLAWLGVKRILSSKLGRSFWPRKGGNMEKKG